MNCFRKLWKDYVDWMYTVKGWDIYNIKGWNKFTRFRFFLRWYFRLFK